MHVKKCNNLEVIFDDPVRELEHANVAMPSLHDIHLEDNPVFKSFCHYKCDFELPSLQLVKLDGCPEMESSAYGIFKTPKVVLVVNGRRKWNDDLNRTVGVRFLPTKMS